jgi:hypothetical protein
VASALAGGVKLLPEFFFSSDFEFRGGESKNVLGLRQLVESKIQQHVSSFHQPRTLINP